MPVHPRAGRFTGLQWNNACHGGRVSPTKRTLCGSTRFFPGQPTLQTESAKKWSGVQFLQHLRQMREGAFGLLLRAALDRKYALVTNLFQPAHEFLPVNHPVAARAADRRA